ncbi:hypothetical protein LPJ64_005735 [Coemansia asiatica]|uniref:Uncharacterized protein n=1 Tax=Coemansia asiatica TaxID=1052880 RepID=A0A9W8CHV8_9FUNG|nr:hypothetical protein LPJ64_005735 [Coemansia asiatica]
MSTLRELEQRARASDIEINARVCLNMSHFKATMRELRKVDDNIILRINSTNTASTDECLALFRVLQTAYARREHDISYCLNVLDEKLKQSPKSFTLQSQRDWIDSEKSVEDIVQKRSLDVFKSRCKYFDFPADFGNYSKEMSEKR